MKMRAFLLGALFFSCCMTWATQQKKVVVLGDTICEVHIDLTGDDLENKRNPFKRSPSIVPVAVTIVDRTLHCYADEGAVALLKVFDADVDDDKRAVAEYRIIGQSHEYFQLPDTLLPGVYFIKVLIGDQCYKGSFSLNAL